MKLKMAALVAVCAAIAACATPPAAEMPASAGADSCGAAEFQALVGHPQSDVPTSSLPQSTRVVCHECAVTMDYREDRLNFWLDAAGKVARVSCG